jgi:tetratricopeptide (TPR) repeat protein
MASVCLCLIVRDEAGVVENCIDSVKDRIDYWVICDTGSRDGTPEIVQQRLAGIAGELHHDRWRDFGHNRTLLMRRARDRADYLLLMDADWTLEAAENAFDGLTADSYLVTHAGATEYKNKLLVKGDLDWRYEGVVHEYITSDQERTCESLAGVRVHMHGAGGERTGRWERDRELLTAQIKRNPQDARSVFYLAQTYRDLGQREQAAETYERRAEMGGWDEEVYCALMQAGVLYAELDQWPRGLELLIRAFEHRPARLEALYELTSRLRLRGHSESAYLFATRGLKREMPPDLLFVQPWIYRWGMLFEFSISAYWAGHSRQALDACDQLLAMPDLPESYRKQTTENRRFCEQRVVANGRERPLPGSRTGAGQ